MKTLVTGVLLLLSLAALAGAIEPPVEIQILYDDTAASQNFIGDYGFSALVTAGQYRVLVDAGADADIFLLNLKRLGIDPASITHTLITHHHADHRKGLFRLALRAPNMKVYFLDSFPKRTYDVAMAVGIDPVRVTGPIEIAPGIHTTGAIDGRIPEQALIVDTDEGPVVVTGSCHPGLVRIVETVEQQRAADSIRLLLGGFHLIRQTVAEILPQLSRLKELRVRQIAPAHSTGELAKRLIRQSWKSDCLATGAGRRLVLQ